jgi:hypothetical protein
MAQRVGAASCPPPPPSPRTKRLVGLTHHLCVAYVEHPLTRQRTPTQAGAVAVALVLGQVASEILESAAEVRTSEAVAVASENARLPPMSRSPFIYYRRRAGRKLCYIGG